MSPFSIVLVRPRNPNNIGAVARAMGNFGLSDLRIVDPFPPVWKEVVSAVGAEDLLEKARLFPSLEEALSDTAFSVAATALRNREILQEIIPLPRLNERLQRLPAAKTAFVFGNEKTGLSNEDIARCAAVLNIPTVSKQPSINLAQAVILTCYELSKQTGFVPLRSVGDFSPKMPTDGQKECVIQTVEELCQRIAIRPDLSAGQRAAFLRRIFTNSSLSREQLFFLKKIVGKIMDQLS